MTGKNIFELISSQYFQLTNSEKKVADYLLHHGGEAQYMSISELAEVCTVADATISRFCRRLGVGGYNAFKLELAKATLAAGASGEKSAAGESGCDGLCARLVRENAAVLEQTAQLLDPAQVQRALELMAEARRVVCMGQGGCMIMAQEAWSMFSMLSPKFTFVPDCHLQMNTTALMDEEDVIFFCSYSGSIRDLQDILEVARGKKVKVILLTRFPKSPAGQRADVVLQCGANESPLHAGSATARMAQLFVLEVLFQHMAEADPKRAEANREVLAQAAERKHV